MQLFDHRTFVRTQFDSRGLGLLLNTCICTFRGVREGMIARCALRSKTRFRIFHLEIGVDFW
jgi:hypothetical protein